QVPAHYQWQVQQQLMVSAADGAHFWVYGDGEGCLVEVKPQPDCFEALQTGWERFWRFVETDEPPPLGPLDTRLRDDPAWAHAAERYLVAKVAFEHADTELAAARGALVGLLEHSKEEGGG